MEYFIHAQKSILFSEAFETFPKMDQSKRLLRFLNQALSCLFYKTFHNRQENDLVNQIYLLIGTRKLLFSRSSSSPISCVGTLPAKLSFHITEVILIYSVPIVLVLARRAPSYLRCSIYYISPGNGYQTSHLALQRLQWLGATPSTRQC